eukprot:6172500-Pleurochrysis_carterae.AAC.4
MCRHLSTVISHLQSAAGDRCRPPRAGDNFVTQADLARGRLSGGSVISGGGVGGAAAYMQPPSATPYPMGLVPSDSFEASQPSLEMQVAHRRATHRYRQERL